MIYDESRYNWLLDAIACQNKSAIEKMRAPISRRMARFIFLGQPARSNELSCVLAT